VNQELPLGQESDEIQGLTEVVAESLAKGDDPAAIAQKLIDGGWEPDQANAFVASIHQQIYENANAGQEKESGGWLLWIGGILGINFLSWLFDWGFWIY
jgi:hypothetical protein